DPPRRRLVPEAGGNEPAVNCTLALERAVHREPAPVRLRRLPLIAAANRAAGGDVLRRGGDLSLRRGLARKGTHPGGVARDAVIPQDLSLNGGVHHLLIRTRRHCRPARLVLSCRRPRRPLGPLSASEALAGAVISSRTRRRRSCRKAH